VITFLSKILNSICLYGRNSFPSNVESFSLKNLGDLPFDRVILMLYLVSCILAWSTKIWRHCIITFLHCTTPYTSSHKCVYNLEQECKYLMQSWMYPIQPSYHRMLSLASSGLLPPWSLPRTSSIEFALCISRHVSYPGAPCCGANSPSFGCTQMLSCKLTVIVRGPLGHPLLSVTNPCWERN
jgi:hypothetical protein